MAAQLGKAYVEISATTDKLKLGLNQAKSQIQTATASMKTMVAGVASMIGTMAIGSALKYSIDQAIEAEAAQVKLASALKLTGDYSQKTMDELNKYAVSLQNVTAYEDDALIAGMAYMKNLGVQTDALQDATQAAIGLAAKYQIDLQSAMQLVGRASQGQTQMLARYGIVLSNTLTPQQKFQELLRIGKGSFQLAKDYAQSAAGQFERFKIAMGNLAEKLGGALLPALTVLAKLLIPILNILQKMSPQTIAWAAAIAIGIAVIANLNKVVGAAIALWQFFANSLAAARAAAGDWQTWAKLAAGLTVAYIAYQQLNSGIQNTLDNMDKGMAGALGKARDEGNKLIQDIQTITKEYAGIITPTTGGTEDPLREQASKLVDLVKQTREATKAEMERRKALVGWTSVGDIWKKAAVFGAQERFNMTSLGQSSYSQGIRGSDTQEVRDKLGSGYISPAEFRKALDTMNKQANSQLEATALIRQMLYYMRGSDAVAQVAG